MKKYILTTILLLLACLIVHSQIIISGSIIDVTNNDPLIGSFISVKSLNVHSVSDEQGNYRLIVPTPSEEKNIVLSATNLGYNPSNQIVTLIPADDGLTITQNFSLEVDPLVLKDIIITANKVEEELQKVPIAVTALTGLDLINRNVTNTDEAFNSIPNLVTDAFLPSQSTFSLRGLASDFVNSIGIENSVGFYIDEVFYSRSFHFNQTLMDIQRVEVLRGVQGTLFGKNTVGGVLHVITEDPKMSNFGSVEFSAGNFNLLQLRGKGNVELVENKLALRVTGAYRQKNSWLIDENPNVEDQNKTLFYGGRASLLYKPNDKLSLLLKGTYSKDNKAEMTIDYLLRADSLDLLGTPAEEKNHLDRRVHTSVDDAQFNRENYAGILNIKYDLDQVHTLTSISAVNGSTGIFTRDLDASSLDALSATRDMNLDAFSQEIRISTPRQNRKLFYVGGFYFLKERIISSDLVHLGNDMIKFWAITMQRPELLNIPDYSESNLTSADINSTSIAGFASLSFEVSERIRMNGGLRYTNEEKTIDFYQAPVGSPYFGGESLIAAPQGSAEKPIHKKVSDSVLSWQVGMDFQTTDNTLIYLNVAKGFKGAGFNTLISRATEEEDIAKPFKPEFISNYELGLKLRSGNRFQFNAAAFVTDFRDKQEANFVGSDVQVVNAKAVQGQGVEVEVLGIWNDFFKTEVALGALNLEYIDFEFIETVGPMMFDTINLSGRKAFKAPGFTFKFAPEIHTNFGKDMKLLIRADYDYVGKVYNDLFNTEEIARQGTGILNARIAISTKDERYSLALWGKNITDEVYFQHAWLRTTGNQVSLNPPRTLGVELRVNFFK